MRQVRNGVFETNSSSTHSITIIKKSENQEYNIPEVLEVCDIEDGRDFEYSSVEEKFTILVVMADSVNRLEEVLKLLNKIGVKKLILSTWKAGRYNEGVGIGFSSSYAMDCPDYYVSEIIKSEETLKDYLFNKFSNITGHNNEYWEE